MKNLRKIIWGIIFIVAAVLIALNSFDIIHFDIFFDGWWTLFIIVPSFVDVITQKFNISSLVCLGVGVFLLLACQDIVEFETIWKLLFPTIVAIIGIKMIVSSLKKGKTDKIYESIHSEGREIKNGTAMFGGANLNFDNIVFDGAELTACFGGLECDLRGAIIDRDCVINATAVFGGIDIKIPDNIKVVNNANAIFGGVDIKNSDPEGAHTLYIEGIAAFGGIDVK